jgi:hypothetical protein
VWTSVREYPPVFLDDIIDGSTFFETESEHVLQIDSSKDICLAETTDQSDEKWGYLIDRYEYTKERGFLYLSRNARETHAVHTQVVTLAIDDPCLGSPTMQSILYHFLGYDAVILNLFYNTFNGTGRERSLN